MALGAAERAFLSQQWRWAETIDQTVKGRFPGAREAEYQSAFVTLGGATKALQIINAVTIKNRRLVVGTCDGIVPGTFKGRPSTIRLRTARFAIGIEPGRLMLLERLDWDYGRDVSTLYLAG